tara:strand:- start:3802 stop:5595 length:1794 start_codon:yes stop_codon:yes gene_type:complete
MVKIKNYNGNEGHPVIMEDPRPGVDGMYFWGQKVNKQTLAPEFDNVLSGNPIGTSFGKFQDQIGMGNTSSEDKHRRSRMMLSKNTVNVSDPQGTNGNSYYENVDPNSSFFIDENNMKGTYIYYITSGGVKSVVMFSQYYGDIMHSHRWGALQDTQSLMDGLQNTPSTELGSDDCRGVYPVGVENGRLVGIGMYHTSGYQYWYPSWAWFSMGAAWPGSYGGVTWNTSNAGNNYNFHHIGTGADGKHRWMRTHKSNLGHVSIWKTVWSGTTPTLTHVLNENSNPSTGGTHYGGNFNNGTQGVIWPSKFYTDPRDSNKKVWYQPYFDTNSQFHPQLITWDTSSDTFARETDISCNVLSQTHVDYSGLNSLTGYYQYMAVYNETFVSGGNRYLSLMTLATYTVTAAGSPQKIITYGINASNPKTLTYHSTLDVGETILNCVWLNDSRTMMGLLLLNSAKIYSWNNTSGWGLTTTIGEFCYGMGRDSLDRIWYSTKSSRFGAYNIDLHVLSPTLPVTITVTPELDKYSYAGSTINSYLNISALNASGNRIAATVKVAIEGASMKFSDDTVVKEITTSSSGETQQNIKVTGAGFINITASVVV